MYWEEASDDRMGFRLGFLLVPATIVLLWVVEIYNANLNKRVDALVELLRQEGILHPELRPESAKKP